MNTFLRKVGKAMVQIKRDWFDTALENYERGEMYGDAEPAELCD